MIFVYLCDLIWWTITFSRRFQCPALSSVVLLSGRLSPHASTITITVMVRTLTITVMARTLTITVMARTLTVTALIIMAVRDTITTAIIGTITGTVTNGAALDWGWRPHF